MNKEAKSNKELINIDKVYLFVFPKDLLTINTKMSGENIYLIKTWIWEVVPVVVQITHEHLE